MAFPVQQLQVPLSCAPRRPRSIGSVPVDYFRRRTTQHELGLMRQPAECEIGLPTRAAWTSRARRQHSHDGAERPDFVIDEDRHLVASANRIESKRRSGKDDISWREIGGRDRKLPPKPLERGLDPAGHWPIVRSGPIRTAISPSIARCAKSSRFKASPCHRTSLSKRCPRIGPCIPNCCVVPGPVQPTL
jgi:hypothetical protein